MCLLGRFNFLILLWTETKNVQNAPHVGVPAPLEGVPTTRRASDYYMWVVLWSCLTAWIGSAVFLCRASQTTYYLADTLHLDCKREFDREFGMLWTITWSWVSYGGAWSSGVRFGRGPPRTVWITCVSGTTQIHRWDLKRWGSTSLHGRWHTRYSERCCIQAFNRHHAVPSARWPVREHVIKSTCDENVNQLTLGVGGGV